MLCSQQPSTGLNPKPDKAGPKITNTNTEFTLILSSYLSWFQISELLFRQQFSRHCYMALSFHFPNFDALIPTSTPSYLLSTTYYGALHCSALLIVLLISLQVFSPAKYPFWKTPLSVLPLRWEIHRKQTTKWVLVKVCDITHNKIRVLYILNFKEAREFGWNSSKQSLTLLRLNIIINITFMCYKNLIKTSHFFALSLSLSLFVSYLIVFPDFKWSNIKSSLFYSHISRYGEIYQIGLNCSLFSVTDAWNI